jgi:pimeloyl-ACP methyl ester carboxylesterase
MLDSDSTGAVGATLEGRDDDVTIWSSAAMEPRFRTIDGLTLRYAESDDAGDDALLLSPWPESLFAFEQMWTRLSGAAHLVAVDLPGFGHSQRRDSLLSPRAMGEFVVRIADAFGLERPHTVGPDIGTAALLFAAAAHPSRLRSVVAGSGGACVPLQLGGRLWEWVSAADVEAYRCADPREVVAGTLQGIERYALPDAVREDYLASYDGDRFVESMRYVRAYPRELPVLAELLPDIVTPVEIIAGRTDAAVPVANATFLHDRLPRSRLDILDAGHFTWEDAAEDYASLVGDWWSGGYAVAGSTA